MSVFRHAWVRVLAGLLAVSVTVLVSVSGARPSYPLDAAALARMARAADGRYGYDMQCVPYTTARYVLCSGQGDPGSVLFFYSLAGAIEVAAS